MLKPLGYWVNTPLKEILDDPKICSYLELHTQSGEDLALASLIAELAVLIGSNTPKKDYYRYIGRGQFPQIARKPLVCKKIDSKDASDDLNLWGEFCSKLDWYIQFKKSDSIPPAVDKLGCALTHLLRVILQRWPDNCPLERMLDFSLDSYGCNNFNELSLVQLELVADSAEMVFNRHTQELITARMQSRTSFVRGVRRPCRPRRSR